MPPFVAGKAARAPQLRDALYSFGVSVGDQTTALSLAYVDIVGLSVPVRPNASYAFDGYIAYVTNEPASCNFAVTGPRGGTASWSSAQLDPTTTPGGGIGDVLVFRQDVLSDTSTGGYGGNGAITPGPVAAFPHGVLATGRLGGTIQFRFAQRLSDANPTTVKAGSWVRAIRIS